MGTIVGKVRWRLAGDALVVVGRVVDGELETGRDAARQLVVVVDGLCDGDDVGKVATG